MPIHLILCGLSQTELIWLYSIKSIVKIDLVIREATCGLDSMEQQPRMKPLNGLGSNSYLAHIVAPMAMLYTSAMQSYNKHKIRPIQNRRAIIRRLE